MVGLVGGWVSGHQKPHGTMWVLVWGQVVGMQGTYSRVNCPSFPCSMSFVGASGLPHPPLQSPYSPPHVMCLMSNIIPTNVDCVSTSISVWHIAAAIISIKAPPPQRQALCSLYKLLSPRICQHPRFTSLGGSFLRGCVTWGFAASRIQLA